MDRRLSRRFLCLLAPDLDKDMVTGAYESTAADAELLVELELVHVGSLAGLETADVGLLCLRNRNFIVGLDLFASLCFLCSALCSAMV